MKIVIQCASGKEESAGHMQTKDGTEVTFVAQPQLAPHDGKIYARPDCLSDRQVSWRTLLQEYNKEYNENSGNNPWNLLPAYKLYKNKNYGASVSKYGKERVYILSAGWGLIRADFLTPHYDITFSSKATRDKKYKRRKMADDDDYQDFQMLPDDEDDPIVFFGGKDYLRLFCKLTKKCRSRITVFYYMSDSADNSVISEALGCEFKPFVAAESRNWHYECLKAFLDSTIEI